MLLLLFLSYTSPEAQMGCAPSTEEPPTSGAPPAQQPSQTLRRGSSRSLRATPILVVTDPGQDLDDECCFLMVRELTDSGHVDLIGCVCTLCPSFDRARLLRGTLDLLGLHNVPIGIGSDGGDLKGLHTADEFIRTSGSYMPALYSEQALTLRPARLLFYSLYANAKPKSLVLLIIASTKDAALFIRDNEALFAAKTKEVVIMGGATVLDDTLVPDTAHNNEFDAVAAKYLYGRCQYLGVPLVVVSRFAAYSGKVPRSVYDELALTGSSIGWRLRNVQRTSIEKLWARACAQGEAVRAHAPRCGVGRTFYSGCRAL